jgi:hypothetical protein
MITVELNAFSVAVYNESGLIVHDERPGPLNDVDTWLMGEGLLRSGEWVSYRGEGDSLVLSAEVTDVAAEVADSIPQQRQIQND